jgi:hypothetical protein
VPSLQHEALLLLFRNRPALAPELLRDALHVPVPTYSEAHLESSDLTDLSPAEYRADLVVLLVEGKPVLGIVVEVQLQRDDRKRFTWPVYVAGLRARLGCPACVLVVTTTDAVADWCRAPIDLALHLSDDRAVLYSDLIFAALSEAAKAALETLMAAGTYEFQSDFAKKHQATGRAEGRIEGRVEGRAEGLAEGFAKAILDVLEARGLAVSDEVHARIASCIDAALLSAYLRKAATATATDQIF